MMHTVGQTYLTLAGLGITYCLARFAIVGYRAARLTVRTWRIARMRHD